MKEIVAALLIVMTSCSPPCSEENICPTTPPTPSATTDPAVTAQACAAIRSARAALLAVDAGAPPLPNECVTP